MIETDGLEKLSPTKIRSIRAEAVQWEKDGYKVIHPLGHESFARWQKIAQSLSNLGLVDWIWIGEETVQWQRSVKHSS